MKGAVGGVAVALVVCLLTPALAQSPPPYRPPVYVAPRGPVPPPAVPIVLTPAQVELLQRALAGAESHGFAPGEFAPRGADQPALIEAAVRYARAVRTGRLNPEGFREDWGLRPQPFDARAGLVRAVAENRLDAWLNSLPPPYPGYETLQRGLADYRQMAQRGGWRPLTPGPDLKLGSVGPAVEELQARLAVEDPAAPAAVARVTLPPGSPPPTPGQPTQVGQPLFDAPLEEAVKRAQKRMGIEPTGVVGAAARAALDIPVERRIDQIVANMERWRWLPQALPADRIQVNVAAGVLTAFRDDQPALSMRAVTGKPGSETPLLSSAIDNIVLNPPWNVPSSIASRELFPKGRGYLAARGFRVIPLEGGGARLQQAPGPGSALGLIKFDFPNPYAVYLHDTPSKGGFSRYTRLASHGCVRLEKPKDLALLLLLGDPVWTPEAIDAAIAAGKTVRVPVGRPMAVFLLYWTAYVTPDGQVNFRQDPYGWDRLLVDRIAAQRGLAT